MAQDPAFLTYYKDVLVSCADWDADILGWYFRLLCHQADKPEGLKGGLEELAALAGVKFSQFERFGEAWKHTLKPKFDENLDGLLINSTQDKHLKDRRGYTDRQAIRGLVGYYIKKMRQEKIYTQDQLTGITPLLFVNLSTKNSKADNEQAFKHTLVAYKEMELQLELTSVLKDKVGEAKIPQPQISSPASEPVTQTSFPFDTELTQVYLEPVEMNQFTHTRTKNTDFILANWQIFLKERLNDPPVERLRYQSMHDLTKFFYNWMRNKFPKNGTHQQRTGDSSQRAGTSTARTDAARNF